MSRQYLSSGNPQADNRYALADQLFNRGDASSAIDLLRQTAELVPLWAPVHFRIAEYCMKSGRKDEALAAFRAYLSLEPEDKFGAQVKIAILTQSTPDQMPSSYVTALFDEYAGRFDHSLVKKLGYRTPDMLALLLNDVKSASGSERILDLGCGTGLSGRAVKSRARLMDGVDLSAGMLVEAEKKNIYFSLTQGDISSFLKTVREPYDLILAADVFVYLGRLEEVFFMAAKALTSDGLFAFSVQHCDHGFHLGADHRYAHSSTYVRTALTSAGLKTVREENAFLRKDGENDINGILFVCARA